MDYLSKQPAISRLGSREAERVSLQAVIAARKGHHKSSAEVIDISATGVRLRTLNPLRLGHTFWIALPMITATEVRVVWVKGFISGCIFTKPLAHYVFQALVEFAKKAKDPVGHTDRRSMRRI